MLINVYILSLVLGAVLLGGVALLRRQEAPTPTTRPGLTTTRRGRASSVNSTVCAAATSSSGPIRSRRFWTFFVSFFGMSGLVLDGLDFMSATGGVASSRSRSAQSPAQARPRRFGSARAEPARLSGSAGLFLRAGR